MKSETFTFKDETGIEIFVNKWIPQDDIKGIIQVAHGMSETASRYEPLARELTTNGFLVVANDHRGHGRTAGHADRVGDLGQDGFNRMIGNMNQLHRKTREQYPEAPYFLLGHSMGSFLLQRYIALYGDQLNGALISGSNGKQGCLLTIGIILAWLESKIKGRSHRSRFINKLTFGAYNKPFKPNRTPFDWLSRDPAEVDKYIADPYCGGVFTSGFFIDFFRFLKVIQNSKNISQIPKTLPLYIFSGDKDPVGGFGKGVMKLIDTYRKAGLQDIQYILYPGGRHEMLNETNRAQVIKGILDWLNRHV